MIQSLLLHPRGCNFVRFEVLMVMIIRLQSAEIWCTNILKKSALHLLSIMWRQKVPLKQWYLSTIVHHILYQKAIIFCLQLVHPFIITFLDDLWTFFLKKHYRLTSFWICIGNTDIVIQTYTFYLCIIFQVTGFCAHLQTLRLMIESNIW
jgi:hypothetical protein